MIHIIILIIIIGCMITIHVLGCEGEWRASVSVAWARAVVVCLLCSLHLMRHRMVRPGISSGNDSRGQSQLVYSTDVVRLSRDREHFLRT
jgi:membrane protein YdbS with pleckstrin-like domain